MKLPAVIDREPMRVPIEHESFGAVTLLVKRVDLDNRCAWTAFSREAVGRSPVKVGYAVGAAIVGWEGVEDTDGNPVPFSLEALDRASTIYPAFGWAVITTALAAFE